MNDKVAQAKQQSFIQDVPRAGTSSRLLFARRYGELSLAALSSVSIIIDG